MTAVQVTRPSQQLARVKVDRAEYANALTPELALDLANAITAAGETANCVILESAGPVFCAGGDYGFLETVSKTDESTALDSIETTFQGVIRSIAATPAVVVAVLQGPALGAGAEIALACDIRIASTRAWLEESWIHLGLIPALGGAYYLPRILGIGSAMEILLTGRRIEPTECFQAGIYQRLADPEELTAVVDAMGAEIATKDTTAVRTIKRLCRQSVDYDLNDSLMLSARAQAQCLSGDGFRSAIATRLRQVRS